MNRFAAILAVGISGLAVASAAQAADLIIEEPVVSVESTGDWDGVYLGVFGGYGWGTGNAFGVDDDLSGWLAGAALGANFTLTDGIVAGIVGDVAWTDISGFVSGPDFTLQWAGSLRGRLGFDGGAFMPYVTGGLAAGTLFGDNGIETDSATHVGWTVGAGVEIAATEDLSMDLLYRYSDYGAQDYTFGGITEALHLTTHQVTAGLNWHF